MSIVRLSIKRKSGLFHLETENEQGNRVSTDGAPSIGGEGHGVRPMELLLSSLGSCSAIDVVLILGKQRQQLDDIQIDVEAEKISVNHHSEFKKIHMLFRLFGKIKEEKARKAIELSLDEYCSVAQVLKKTSEITYDLEIINAE